MDRRRFKADIKQMEGCRLLPYHDTLGNLTIGYGRNLSAVGITKLEAEIMLNHDIEGAERDAESLEVFSKLSEVRQEVLVNMIFNMGLPRLKSFRKMLAALEAGDYETAADEMLDSRWHHQVGRRAEILAQRMRTGEYETTAARD